MTLRDYAYEILELARKRLTDDIDIDVRLVEQLIIDQRNLDLKRIIENKKGQIPYTTLFAYAQSVPISLTDSIQAFYSDCGTNISYIYGEFGKGHDVVIINGNLAIFFLQYYDSTGVKRNIKIIPRDKALSIGSGRFNSNELAAFVESVELYVVSRDPSVINDFIQVNNKSALCILRDPRKASNYTDSMDFPIGENWAIMQDYIVEKLVKKDHLGNDIINDGTDNLMKEA